MTRARELGKLANKNTLTADNTNNFVGIASTQPTTRLDVVGVVSATSFSGDGSSLTGVASTENIITGTAATFNNVVKVGTAITLDATSGIVTAAQFSGDATGLTGTPDITVRNIIGVAATLSGTLTYEDVTNIDSIGIITAVNGFVGNVTGNATGLSGTPDITVRNVTGVAATFTGVLTYDDVTNVDSLGIVTARSGVEFGASGVGGTITAAGSAEFAGIVTATEFHGDASNLTNLPASGDSNDITASLFI